MIGLDSNVMLRAITGDDPVQSPVARRLLSTLSSRQPGVLNLIVLVELAWTLRVHYKFRARDILARIEDLLRSDLYHIVDRHIVVRAMEVSAEHSLDFADALIGEINRDAGCTTTMTFDQSAAQTPSFTQLQ